MKYTLPALALAISATLGGCASHHSAAVAQPVVNSPAVNVAQPLQRQLAEGVYEMALSPQGDALYVASAEGFKDVQGGAVYKLDPQTLNTIGLTHTDLKNFALQLSADGKTLFVSNSLDGGISAIDTATGKVKNRLLFSERNEKGLPYGARQLLLLNNTLYVGAVADPAQIWVVDATTLKLKTRIKNTGKWMTGLHYSAQTGRVYAANGSGEILVINPRNQRIEQRWKPLGDKPALLLNMAEDSDTGVCSSPTTRKRKPPWYWISTAANCLNSSTLAIRWRCSSMENATKFIFHSVKPARSSALTPAATR